MTGAEKSRALGVSREIAVLYAEVYRHCHPPYTSPISHQGVRALQHISMNAPTVNELAARLQCAPNTASEIVKRLTERDFVSKSRKKDDERVVELAITSKGRAALEEHTGLDAERLRTALSALDERKIERIRVGLITLLAAVQGSEMPC